jgi:hypothetical protein
MNTEACERHGVRRLNSMKPTMTQASGSSSVWSSMPAAAAKAAKTSRAISATPPARPSTPSIMFIALITPSTANTVIGAARTPVVTSPKPNRSPKLSRRMSAP